MRYAGLIENDIVDSDDGICVSLWMQGCPHHCKGCHNPETWDFNGGTEIDREKLVENVISSLTQNGIKRNFSVLGGEPLAPENLGDAAYIISKVRENFPDIKIYLWTGYVIEELNKKNIFIKQILKNIDVLIDGPFILEKKDLTLKLRGSTNQRIFKNIDGKLK
jgi:anaerobic ribonucleoside-triphosphate reductase activating protein